MGASAVQSQQRDAARMPAVRRAAAPGETRQAVDPGVPALTALAREGTLAAAAATAEGTERRVIVRAAYDLVWPIVFARVTRRFERRRGHAGCSVSVERLADECLDRFHDDVEAVVEDLLTHADRPVHNLEAWIAGRLNAATVDGHRRRRGRRGALQRPRIPGWLADELGRDRWLIALATELLGWVGVPVTAGNDVWPLEAWAQRRAEMTGDWTGSEPPVVAREVERVLVAMRSRIDWYERYVERPLGRKETPVAAAPPEDAAVAPLAPADRDARADAELTRLAAYAVEAIGERIGRGESAAEVVVDVLGTVFGRASAATDVEQPPHAGTDPGETVLGALGERADVDRIVAAALDIVGAEAVRAPQAG
ncbi:hypothetical protein ACGFKZ_15370 [Micromonospora tulbaghiae]|uniref:hypothetical protein n=1 Tax=Micromonospora tulbaghiae TaxID=479978 RepID=UPI00341154CF